MQQYSVEITLHGTDHFDRDRIRQALGAALEDSTAREALDEALFSALYDECVDRNHEGGESSEGDEPTRRDVKQPEHAPVVSQLQLVPSPPDRDSRWVLYDFDGNELFSKVIYDSHDEAVEDACQADDVIVVPFHSGRNETALGTSGEMEGHCYDLSIDGPAFRAQRQLLLQLFESSQQQTPVDLSPEQGELLEGLVNLTDAIADQAADHYGIECLL